MEIGLFDVLGPVMIGPSSSHTAGAAKLGSIARQIAGAEIKRVDFFLHGSLAQTYQGHGTDKALLGGVLGLKPDDEQIADSFAIAAQQGIEFGFHAADLGNVHPNTVKIVTLAADGKIYELVGSSVGGGKISVNSLNGMKVEFSGQYPTIITSHLDRPGVLANVCTTLSRHGINIAFLEVFRQLRGSKACMVLESDQPVDDYILDDLGKLPDIYTVTLVQV